MEYVTGANVCDAEGLQRMGLKASDVAKLVSETFNEMIFIHGDVHCDPHAANMLVSSMQPSPAMPFFVLRCERISILCRQGSPSCGHSW